MNEWWDSFTTVQKVFWMIAIPFSLITLIQLILEIVGLSGHSAAVDHNTDLPTDDGGGVWDHLQFFSVRNMIYFLMMFGWVGLATTAPGRPVIVPVVAGIIAGLLTSLFIAWIFYMLNKLNESGTAHIVNAVGLTGKVYIPIPAGRSGTGQIQLVLQGATQEIDAITEGEPLPTGRMVKVVEALSETLLLVEAV